MKVFLSVLGGDAGQTFDVGSGMSLSDFLDEHLDGDVDLDTADVRVNNSPHDNDASLRDGDTVVIYPKIVNG